MVTTDCCQELQINLSEDVIFASSNDEGVIFNLKTQKSCWVNESGASLLNFFQSKNQGVPLSSARNFIRQNYEVNDQEKADHDVEAFVSSLFGYNVVSIEHFEGDKDMKMKEFNVPQNASKISYIKPMVKDDLGFFPTIRAAQRAAKMAAERSYARSTASASGFKSRA